jgi:hypothetical protein
MFWMERASAMLEEGKNDALEQGGNRKSVFVMQVHTGNKKKPKIVAVKRDQIQKKQKPRHQASFAMSKSKQKENILRIRSIQNQAPKAPIMVYLCTKKSALRS